MTSRYRFSLVAALVAAAIACAPAERDTVDTMAVDTTPAATEYEITLREWGLDMAQDTLPAGPAVFVARNTGQYEHALEIEIEGTELETGPIPPGAEARLALDLWPGTYTVYCPVNDDHGDHRERGMRGTFVVR